MAKDCSLFPKYQTLSSISIEERSVEQHKQILSIVPKIWTCKNAPSMLYHKAMSAMALYKFEVAERAVHHYFLTEEAFQKDSVQVLMYRLQGHLAWERNELDAMFKSYTKAIVGIESGIGLSAANKSKVYLDLGMAHKLHETRQDSLMYLLATKSIKNAQDINDIPQRNRLLARAYLYRGNLIYQWNNTPRSLQLKGLQDLWKAENLLKQIPNSLEYIDALGTLGLLSARYYGKSRGLSYAKGAVKVAQQLDLKTLSTEQKGYTLLSAQLFYGELLYKLEVKKASVNFEKTKAIFHTVMGNPLAAPKDLEMASAYLAKMYEIENQPKKAIQWAKTSLDYGKSTYEQLGSEWIYDATKNQRPLYALLSRCYLKQNKIEEALLILNEQRDLYVQIFKAQYQSLQKLAPKTRSKIQGIFQKLSNIHSKPTLAFGDYLALATLAQDKQKLLLQANALQKAIPLNLNILQKRLKSQNENLLFYDLDTLETVNPKSFGTLFLVRPDTLLSFPLSYKRQHFNPANLYRSTFTDSLYSYFFKSAKPFINAKHLVVISDLKYPLASFSHQNRFLIQDFSFRYSPSIAQLYKSSKATLSEFKTSFWGKSDFSHLKGLSNLPTVPKEAETIKPFSPHIFLESAMQESDFLNNLQQNKVRSVHISTHGIQQQNPIFSAFAFQPKEKDNGFLHFFEFYGSPISADLLFLNTCYSGGTAEGEANRFHSFSSAFLSAGAKSVVASVWEAPDKSAFSLMDTFYKALRSGIPSDIALQKAQIAFIKSASPIQKRPYFWGGFTINGSRLMFKKP